MGNPAEDAALRFDHLERGGVKFREVGAHAVFRHEAVVAAIIGLAQRGVDADLGGDAGEDELADAAILQNRGIRQLILTGVTTEVCVHTTLREANDRGYDCLVPEDCVGSYFPEFHTAALKMIKAQGGIFGWVSHSTKILTALAS